MKIGVSDEQMTCALTSDTRPNAAEPASSRAEVLSTCRCGRFRCVSSAMLGRNDTGTDLREAIVAAHQSVKGYKAVFKPFITHHSSGPSSQG